MITSILSPLTLLVVGVAFNHDWAEPHDVETAARYYRIQVYETFRTDRPEYDARIELGRDLLNKANRAETDARRAQLMAWFDSATSASTTGQISALPELPEAEWLANLPSDRDTTNEAHTDGGGFDGLAADDDVEQAPLHRSHTLSPAARTDNTEPNHDRDRDRSPSVSHLVSRVGRALARSLSPDGEAAEAVEQTTQWSSDTDSDNLGTPQNIDELNARMAGQNLAVEAVERRLSSEWSDNLDELEALVNKLQKLTDSQRELELVLEAVPSEARKQLIQLDTVDGAMQQLSSRLVQLQTNLAGENEELEGPAETIDRIEGLQKRVQELMQ